MKTQSWAQHEHDFFEYAGDICLDHSWVHEFDFDFDFDFDFRHLEVEDEFIDDLEERMEKKNIKVFLRKES